MQSITQTESRDFARLCNTRLDWIERMQNLLTVYAGKSLAHSMIVEAIADRINAIVNNLLFQECKCAISYQEYVGILAKLKQSYGVAPAKMPLTFKSLHGFVYSLLCNAMQFRGIAWILLTVRKFC